MWIFIWGTWQLLAAGVYLLPTIESLLTQSRITYSSFGYTAYGFPADLAALLVLRFAEQIVSFTYRR